MEDYGLTHLETLEAESLHVLREVAAESESPVLLFSAGKDSCVLAWLAQKAFAPAPIPFPFLHVDTGCKFPEMYPFRDSFCQSLGVRLITHRNEPAIAKGTQPSTEGRSLCCQLLKTQALLRALKEGEFTTAIGGARRDEERSRAKERFFSIRDAFGQWDPKKQRPEIWNFYNGRVQAGESVRAFPLSNWTEVDIWNYIAHEDIPVSSLYFAQEREVTIHQNQIMPIDANCGAQMDASTLETVLCRYRTLGCLPCTGAIRSSASTIEEIMTELRHAPDSERANRLIDHEIDAAMERKKEEGYF